MPPSEIAAAMFHFQLLFDFVNNHVDVISLKAQKMLSILYQICKDINDVSTKKLLYIAWVCSHLEYGSMIAHLILNET